MEFPNTLMLFLSKAELYTINLKYSFSPYNSVHNPAMVSNTNFSSVSTSHCSLSALLKASYKQCSNIYSNKLIYYYFYYRVLLRIVLMQCLRGLRYRVVYRTLSSGLGCLEWNKQGIVGRCIRSVFWTDSIRKRSLSQVKYSIFQKLAKYCWEN